MRDVVTKKFFGIDFEDGPVDTKNFEICCEEWVKGD